ncbi:MAG: ABC-F family ATP-binding cassette domain-containing protein [Verrucomicrobiales bacterium]|nr:ABC-F family ATP-binding cassette domain-containing protein [Verrucomicrobiales bacterium]
MLAVDKVSIQFGGRTLFRDLSLTVRAKDRLSLAGPNGAGKSTLLKIIAGIENPDSGRIVKAKQATVGYLPQEGVKHAGSTLFAEAKKAFGDVLLLQKQVAEVEAELESLDPAADAEAYADALEVLGDLQIRLEHHDVARMKPRIETVLGGLGFKPEAFDRPTETFSGGWQMRIALAKLLLQEPSVLLLDEPTNHLDIETVQWLEQWLRTYDGSIILISHDRSLLDALSNRTLAFESGQVQHYSGNYSFYLQERQSRREQLERSFRNQQREIEKAEQLINRFRAKATKAKMVQSRIKQLDKIERIELETEESGIGFRFPQPERSGQSVLKLEGIGKRYGENQVLDGLDFEFERGDRIAILGVNGAGKSTFSRIVAGVESATAGTRKVGHKVGVAYFSQNHADELDPAKTVLETIEKGATTAAITMNLRTLLGAFLFRGDDVFKSVGVLSGGERSRLALARMLLQPANFLILDEPTNHLDMQSQEVLQRALADYTGTYAIVSHNRSFLDPIVTKVLEFIPHRPMRVYHGNVSDYLEKKAAEMAAAAGPAAARGTLTASAASAAPGDAGLNRKDQRRVEAQRRQQKAEALKPLSQRLTDTEARIAALEEEKESLTRRLIDPDFFKKQPEEARVASERLHTIDAEVEEAYSAWSKVTDEIEKVEARFAD